MAENPIEEILPSISEELISNIYDKDECEDESMDIISAQYDLLIEKELANNLPTIGYCGFLCDGECSHCKGKFDINDEI